MNRRGDSADTVRLLRWVFRRDDQLVTCQLDRETSRPGYTLALVPHWDVRQTIVTSFEESVPAFQHHAALASELRQQGWTLASYDAPQAAHS